MRENYASSQIPFGWEKKLQILFYTTRTSLVVLSAFITSGVTGILYCDHKTCINNLLTSNCEELSVSWKFTNHVYDLHSCLSWKSTYQTKPVNETNLHSDLTKASKPNHSALCPDQIKPVNQTSLQTTLTKESSQPNHDPSSFHSLICGVWDGNLFECSVTICWIKTHLAASRLFPTSA